jgi:hypothetical protein
VDLELTNEECPSETETTEVEAFVEVVRPALHLLQNPDVTLGQARRDITLEKPREE